MECRKLHYSIAPSLHLDITAIPRGRRNAALDQEISGSKRRLEAPTLAIIAAHVVIGVGEVRERQGRRIPLQLAEGEVLAKLNP